MEQLDDRDIQDSITVIIGQLMTSNLLYIMTVRCRRPAMKA